MKTDMKKAILGFVTGGVAFALLFVAWVYPEIPSASYALAALLVVLLGALAWMNQAEMRKAIQTRSVRYGTNAALTLGLVAAIVLVLNYLNYNHYVRKDLTKNKTHSLSEQTVKILKELKQDVKLSIFIKTGERDAVRPLIENYHYYAGKKLSVEWIDPDREPTRTKAANVKKYGTVIVQSGKRDSRVEEASEEKLTNAFLKVLKENSVTICFVTGHGEKNVEGSDPDGFSQFKRDLASQNYETKTLNFLEEPKVPTTCTVVMVLGPTKGFFDKEIVALREWMDNGGRALVALDPNLRSEAPLSKEMQAFVGEWFVTVKHDLVLDPTSRAAGVGPEVPIIALYSKEHPITRDFQLAALFPATTTLDLKPGVPTSLKQWWIARSTPNAFAKTDFVKELSAGKPIGRNPNKDVAGPNTVMVAVEGSRDAAKKPPQPSRLIVMGTSLVATNKWSRFAGNNDLMLNAVSWLAGDDNLISIRPKEEGSEKPTLSEVELSYSKFLSKLVIPGGSMFAGLLVWRRRRKL